jgi:hypothetical protein
VEGESDESMENKEEEKKNGDNSSDEDSDDDDDESSIDMDGDNNENLYRDILNNQEEAQKNRDAKATGGQHDDLIDKEMINLL